MAPVLVHLLSKLGKGVTKDDTVVYVSANLFFLTCITQPYFLLHMIKADYPFFLVCFSLDTRSLQGLGSIHSLKFNQALAVFVVETLLLWETETTGCRDISWKMSFHLFRYQLQVHASAIPSKGHSVALRGQYILDGVFCDRIQGSHGHVYCCKVFSVKWNPWSMTVVDSILCFMLASHCEPSVVLAKVLQVLYP